MRGEVIALNGTSSAGKSTLAAEMQTQLVARNRCWVILGIDDFLGKLREMFNAGEPVDFVADILTATEVDKVLVSDLAVGEVAGTPHSFRYAIVLTQHVEPPPSSPGADLGFGDLGDLDASVLAEAVSLVSAMQIPDLIASVPDREMSALSSSPAVWTVTPDQHLSVQSFYGQDSGVAQGGELERLAKGDRVDGRRSQTLERW